MKTRAWKMADGSREGISIRCEGCGGWHSVTTKGPDPWAWNGDTEKPILSPSLLTIGGNAEGETRCHTFIGCNGAQPGEVIFLSDCTHALAGQVRPLLDWNSEPPEVA
ncbi:DUF6527 family protein [Deinococcus sp. UYEF24]